MADTQKLSLLKPVEEEKKELMSMEECLDTVGGFGLQ
jgi:hypothetical protein